MNLAQFDEKTVLAFLLTLPPGYSVDLNDGMLRTQLLDSGEYAVSERGCDEKIFRMPYDAVTYFVARRQTLEIGNDYIAPSADKKDPSNYARSWLAMVEAFLIFAKYTRGFDELAARHDVICAGPDPKLVSKEDVERLKTLGWHSSSVNFQKHT